ncbi:hypothetical protein [Klebsiella pneumoniae]|uniref:hypothetical protein n=1 Tax=Klebsiella pneumoniae TaxID=573 RepID=UPI003970DE06
MLIENCKFEYCGTGVMIDKSLSKHVIVKNTIAINCRVGFWEYDNKNPPPGITASPDNGTLKELEDKFEIILQTIKKQQFTTKKNKEKDYFEFKILPANEKILARKRNSHSD